ncbi:TraB/GumN family protein [Muricoccus nepalensis]|uniref:TraB/GumN family protein n=1 Tax=Muricoccus nepalensis TaxID=1854500 RepID=UPI00112BA6E4|nr:TraB/GumN family protein [Roseomonas nepalensis]
MFAVMTPIHAQRVDYPALQITTPDGGTSLLLGTMHQGDDRVPLPLPVVVEQALRLVVASDLLARPLPPRAGGPPPDLSPQISLGSILDEGEKATLRTRVQCHLPQNSTPSDIEVVTSFALSGPIRVTADFAALCPTPGQPSVESWLKKAAAARGVPLDSLEGTQDSSMQRAALPDRIFISNVRRILSSQGSDLFARLTTFLNTGDYEGICGLVRENFASSADWDLFEQRLVSERNAHWMPVLERYLEEGQAVIMVGASHLCGENGLPALLSKKGYQIESIRIPAVGRPPTP